MPDKALVNGSQGLGAARVHERQKRAFHVKQAHWYLGIYGSNTPGHGLSGGPLSELGCLAHLTPFDASSYTWMGLQRAFESATISGPPPHTLDCRIT